jgi:hypothetical protein
VSQPVTIEKIERLIDAYWLLGFNEGLEGRQTDTPDGDAQETRAAISASLLTLQQERDRLREEQEEVSRAIGSVRWMDPPDGGSVSLGEQVRRVRVDLETAEKWCDNLRDALTPSADTKAAYIGEFHERIEIANPMFEGNEDDEPETIAQSVTVSWTTITEIMAAILAQASEQKP